MGLTSLKRHFDLFLVYLKDQTCLFSGFIKSVGPYGSSYRLHTKPWGGGVKSVSLSLILSFPAVQNKMQQQQQQRAPRDTAYLSTYDNSTYICATESQLNKRHRHA